MKNKKGFVGDILTWVILLGVLVLIVFFGYLFISAGAESTEGIVKSSLQTSTLGWARGWDIAIMTGFGLALVATLTSAWFIGTNPIFFWISFITFVFFLLGTVVVGNLLQSVVNKDTFLVLASQMPGTIYLVNNVFAVVLGGGILLVIVLFAKFRSD